MATPAVRKEPVETLTPAEGIAYGSATPRLREVGTETRDPDNR
jgi:hypothetical protein